jgi:hypothetical protein
MLPDYRCYLYLVMSDIWKYLYVNWEIEAMTITLRDSWEPKNLSTLVFNWELNYVPWFVYLFIYYLII